MNADIQVSNFDPLNSDEWLSLTDAQRKMLTTLYAASIAPGLQDTARERKRSYFEKYVNLLSGIEYSTDHDVEYGRISTVTSSLEDVANQLKAGELLQSINNFLNRAKKIELATHSACETRQQNKDGYKR